MQQYHSRYLLVQVRYLIVLRLAAVKQDQKVACSSKDSSKAACNKDGKKACNKDSAKACNKK